MTYEREAVTAAVQIADLNHLLSRHALQALRDAQRARCTRRRTRSAGCSRRARRRCRSGLRRSTRSALVMTTLTLGASTVELQACSCSQAERALSISAPS
jgi:hypothetical protein